MIELPNPVWVLQDVFNAKYPDAECEMYFVQGMYEAAEVYGETCWPEEGGLPIIQVDVELPFESFVEVVAHELAHIVCSFDKGHGPEFKKVFEELRIGFNEEFVRRYPHTAGKDAELVFPSPTCNCIHRNAHSKCIGCTMRPEMKEAE